MAKLTEDPFVLLACMKELGSSVVLTWGEDNDLWECSWITSGIRCTATSKDLGIAVAKCWNKRVGVPVRG